MLKAQVSRGVQWGGGGEGGGNMLPQEFFLDLNSLKSPLLGFCVIQTGYWPVPFSPDEALQIGQIISSRSISIL